MKYLYSRVVATLVLALASASVMATYPDQWKKVVSAAKIPLQ